MCILHLARACLYLLARLARARVKCSRARAAHPAAGEAPYMNSYVLNQANIYIYNYTICVFMSYHVVLPKQARITMSKTHMKKNMVPKSCTTFKIYSLKNICQNVIKTL